MTTDNQPQVPLPAPAADAWLTTGWLVLIGIGVVLALLLIWWGARLRHRRRATERELLARNEQASPHTGSAAATPPPAIRDAPDVAVPPVAPSPPPLASSDTPVVAAAPFDASPAAIAAEPEASPQLSDAEEHGSAHEAQADDLTRIKGLGPKLALQLGELGITRYAQIADLSPEQAQALDAQLGAFRGRLDRDRWIEQARYLARGDRDGFEAAFGKL